MDFHSSQIYRIIVPKFIRRKILFKALRKSIMDYYSSLSQPHSEEIEIVLNYLKTNPIKAIPYQFTNEYIADKVEVFDDKTKGLRYVLFNGKRLYFKKKWGKRKIQLCFNGLIKEQDQRSPHCYTNEIFKVENDDVLIDVGAAEGIFALGVVERASRLILFEADKEWIEPLKATFENWKDKVTIVNKFVSDVSNSNNTTLDDFIPTGNRISFLKIDVEGAESKLLNGCKRILQEQKPLRVAICTYHRQNDEKNFKELLVQNGFEVTPSSGFMLYHYDKKIAPPYFRRGLIRATKIQ